MHWKRFQLPQMLALNTPPYELEALDLFTAVALAKELPSARRTDNPLPDGWGVFPPVGAEPHVTIQNQLVDPFGQVVSAGARGVLGCLFNRNGRVVFVLWFRANEQGKGLPFARGPVFTYEDNIRGVLTLEGKVPFLVGWQLQRLDTDTGRSVIS